MSALPQIDAEREVEKVTRFIKDTITRQGFTDVIIACSGGVDSSVSAALAVRALGNDHVFTLQMPYKKLHEQAVKDVTELLQKLQIPEQRNEIISIEKAVDVLAICSGLAIDTLDESERIRLGNIMARIRMIFLYDRAKKHKALVIGTENKSEYLLGYFTRFGDEASDIEPIRHLYKTQVYQLARHLELPESIINKAPSANLWEGQTDEGQFGFSYAEADQILYGYIDQKMNKNQLIDAGFSVEIVNKVIDWVDSVHFKHQLPFVVE